MKNFIGGEFVPTQDSFDNLNPATSQRLCEVPRSGAAEVDAAAKAALAAQPGWAALSVEDRATWLERIADAIEADLDAFAQLESRDQGKPVWLAKAVDIPRAVSNFRFFASAVRQHHDGVHRMPGALNYTARNPIGVVGLITPWNLPLYLLTWKLAPALAMGNAIVAKPSELTPCTADRLARLFQTIDAPAGIFNLVHGYGAECGQAMLEHPDIKAISFTGGTATGRVVARTAAPLFKKLSLELGGKNATVVFDDCDFEATVDGAVRAGFANQGEICLCGSRLLVQRGIADRFIPAFIERATHQKVGDPSAPDTRVGALNSTAHRDKVESYLKLASEEGGTVHGGGRPALDAPFSSGAFLNPAVVTGLAPTSRTSTEEIFGPVVTVHVFDTEEQAIAIANGTDYGLAASVWTQDLGTAHRVADALEVGMVWVNTWLLRDLRVPFGGVKHSGVGREGGHYSLEFFSESKNICIKM